MTLEYALRRKRRMLRAVPLILLAPALPPRRLPQQPVFIVGCPRSGNSVLVEVLKLILGPLHLNLLGLEEVGQGAGDNYGIGFFQREDAKFSIAADVGVRQLGDDAIDLVQLVCWAGEDQGVGAFLDGDDDLRRGIRGSV